MDIQTSFNNQILQAMKTLVENNLNLTVGQQLVTKVIAINTTGITLKWGAQTLTVENQNPRATFTPYIGQNATLQVVKTTPQLEFKLIAFDAHSYETPPSAEKMNAMRLSLATAPLATRLDESMRNFSTHADNQHPLEAKVVGLVGHKIQLELLVDDHRGSATSNKKMLVSVEPRQLQLLPSQSNEPLKVGQTLTLAITKIGAVPEFKQLPSVTTPANLQEEKIATFMKQLLPRHESPSVLLSELKTDLPQLAIKNETLASTLKENASALFEHLPPNEQLFNPQKLRHLIYSSGVFFDAKDSATIYSKPPTAPVVPTNQPAQPTAPVDLKMPLLNLLQHTSATNELKQLASTLLQNLLKQESAPPTPELEQLVEQNKSELHAQLLTLARSETIPQSLKTLSTEILSILKEPTALPEKSVVEPAVNSQIENLQQLLKQPSISPELKQLASTLLQNLVKKDEAPPTSELLKLIETNETALHPQLVTLTQSATIPQTLKNLAAEILSNLKQPPVLVEKPTDNVTSIFKTNLQQLIDHPIVSNDVKQLASSLLQNLTKQETTLPTPELLKVIEQEENSLHTQLTTLTRSETIPQSLKIIATEILPFLKSPTVAMDATAILPVIAENNSVVVDDAPITSDFKNELLKLVETLKHGIAQHTELDLTDTQVQGLQHLQTKTENALAKVVLDQLNSLPKEDSSKQVWRFELPFLMNNQVETLKLDIQRDKVDKDSQNANTQMQNWSVNLTLTPPNLGEVQCVILYQNGVVNAYFKNQQPQTTALISEHLDNLKQQLQQVGLSTGFMSAHNNFQPIKSAYSQAHTSFLNETA